MNTNEIFAQIITRLKTFSYLLCLRDIGYDLKSGGHVSRQTLTRIFPTIFKAESVNPSLTMVT
jgi:hypothetical protein